MARKKRVQWADEARTLLSKQGFSIQPSDHRAFDFVAISRSGDQRKIKVASRPRIWNKNIDGIPRDWVMFQEQSGWYLVPHSELVDAYGEARNGNPLSSRSWLVDGAYFGANLTRQMRETLAKYRMSDEKPKPPANNTHPLWEEEAVLSIGTVNHGVAPTDPNRAAPNGPSDLPVTNDRLRPPDIDGDAILLVILAARYCLMPHPNVVSRLDVAPFPVIRDSGKRWKTAWDNGRTVMYDDNTIPRWVIFWSHGDGRTAHIKGCSVAHIWAKPKDPDVFTNIANLAIIPECLASLTDKDGPLVPFLQYHAQSVYGWRPKDCAAIEKPPGYDCIKWNYIEPGDDLEDPNRYIQNRLMESRSKPAECLLELITRPTQFQAPVRQKKQKEQGARLSSRDFSKFTLTVAGQEYSGLYKRNLMYYLIRNIIQTGVKPEDLEELVTTSKLFIRFEGTLDEEQFAAKLMFSDKGGAVPRTDRYFCKQGELFAVGGKTWALTNQWTLEGTQAAVNSIRVHHPDLDITMEKE